MVFVCTAMGVLYVEHANVLELCYIELLSGDGSPYSILSDINKEVLIACSLFQKKVRRKKVEKDVVRQPVFKY